MSIGIEAVREYYSTKLIAVGSPFYGLNYSAFGFLERTLTNLGIDIEDRTVLDVGSGLGKLSDYCVQKRANYVGLDITPDLVRQAKSCFRDSAFLVADGKALPFENEAFDCIFCVDVFEHIPDQNRVCAEFFRVLRPGGKVFLSSPNYSNVCGLLKVWHERMGTFGQDKWSPFSPDKDWTPQVLEQFMTPWRVQRLFGSAGFSQFKYIGHEWEIAVGLFPWVWHPKTPNLVKRCVNRLVRYVQKPLAQRLPFLSLHTFWGITRP